MCKRVALFSAAILLALVCRAYAWQIDEFRSDIQVNTDGSITVAESILADFSDLPKHGIYRNIPVRYRDEKGNALSIGLEVLSVVDENGSPWQYSESYTNADKMIRIGSPSKTYNGKKLFLIKYKVIGALLYLANHDELFWNATGTEWDAPIRSAIVTVHLPDAIQRDSLMTAAYSGSLGSRASNVRINTPDAQTVVFTGGGYSSYEGVTVAVGWPKGLVKEVKIPTGSGHHVYFLFALGMGIVYFSFSVPIIVFLVMFFFWNKYGKDPRYFKSVVVEYKAPEDLTPAEVGTIIDDTVNTRDITSSIIDLAVRGYLKIELTHSGLLSTKEYAFIKLKDFSDDKSLHFFEREILDGIFGTKGVTTRVPLKDLECEFYEHLAVIRKDIYDTLVDKKYYLASPDKVRSGYIIVAIILLALGFFSFVLLMPFGFSLIISAVIVFAFSHFMPRKTPKGMDVYGKILGFEEFLQRTDKDKIRSEEQQGIFEKMLPYALCLGISSQWAKAFEGIYTHPPEWFAGDYRGVFYTNLLLNDLNSAMTSMNTTLTSMPRSTSSSGGFGGGGFSGGGFGGGGGGSW